MKHKRNEKLARDEMLIHLAKKAVTSSLSIVDLIKDYTADELTNTAIPEFDDLYKFAIDLVQLAMEHNIIAKHSQDNLYDFKVRKIIRDSAKSFNHDISPDEGA